MYVYYFVIVLAQWKLWNRSEGSEVEMGPIKFMSFPPWPSNTKFVCPARARSEACDRVQTFRLITYLVELSLSQSVLWTAVPASNECSWCTHCARSVTVCVCGAVHVLDGSVLARSYFKVPWTTKWEHSFVTTWRGCVVCVRVCVCARSVTHGTCALSLWGRKKITQYIWHCMFPIIKWN